MADQIQPTVGVPQVIGVNLAPSGPVARGRVVAHLHGAGLGDGLRQLVYGLPVLTVGLVGAHPDREMTPQLFDVARSLSRECGRSLVERRVERRLEFGAVQGFQQIPAEDQSHEFGGREGQRQDLTIAVHQTPADLAVAALRNQRNMSRLQGFEVAPNRPGVAGQVFGQGRGQLLEGRASGSLQLLQQQPLTGDLIVTRHNFGPSYQDCPPFVATKMVERCPRSSPSAQGEHKSLIRCLQLQAFCP